MTALKWHKGVEGSAKTTFQFCTSAVTKRGQQKKLLLTSMVSEFVFAQFTFI